MKNLQLFLKKRRFALFITTFCLFVIFLFRHTFVGYGTQLLLNVFFPSETSFHFTFEKVKWKENQFVFHDFSISVQASKSEVPFHFYTEELGLGFEFSLRRFDITPKIKLFHPYIQLESHSESSKDLNLNIIPLLTKISQQMKLEIDNGEICFVKENQKASAFFSFDQSREKNEFGTFYIAESINHLPNPAMEVSISSLHYELLTSVIFNDLSLQWLLDVLKLTPIIHDSDLQGGGKINGEGIIHYSQKGEINHFSVKTKAEDLFFEQAKNESVMKVDYFELDTSYPAKDKKLIIKEKWWNQIQLNLEISKAAIGVEDFALKDFYGKIQIGAKQPPLIALKGVLYNDKEESTFRLKGVPCIDQQHLLSAELLLRNKEKPENDGIIDFVVTQIEQSTLSFAAHIHQVEASFLRYFTFLQPLRKIIVHQGSIDGVLRGEWNKRDHYSVEAEHLLISGLSYSDNQSIITSGKINLDGRIVCEEKSFLVPFATFNVDEVCIANHNYPQLNTDSMQVAVHIIDNEFIDSEINGQIGDSSIYIGISNKVLNPKIQCILDANLNITYPFFQNKQLLQQVKSFPDHFVVSMNLEKGQADWRCGGKIEIERLDHRIEKLEFETILEDKFFFAKNIDELIAQIKEGNIQGKKISEVFYQLPITMIGMNFELFGEIDVMGTIDSKGCTLLYTTDDFFFITKEVEVSIKKEFSNKEITGKIYFPFDTKIFNVEMPIHQARCNFKPKQLHFEKIDGQLLINAEDLYLINLKGYAKEGIETEGKIYLHFQGVDADYFDLHVTRFKGFASQFIEFATHFPEFPKMGIDINGFIEQTKDGLKLQTRLIPQQKDPDWKISFHLKEGMVASSSDIELKNISFDLDFDSTVESLNISELRGQLVSNSNDKGKTHSIYMPIFSFKDIHYPSIEFDIRLEDEIIDLVRFVGKGYTNSENGQIIFDLEGDFSKVGESKWQQFSIVFSNKWDLLLFKTEISFSSDTIQNMVTFLNNYGFVSHNFSRYVSLDRELDPIHLFIQIDKLQNQFDIQLSSKDMLCSLYREFDDLHMLLKWQEIMLSATLQKEKNQIALFDIKGSYLDSYFIAPIGHINNEAKQVNVPLITFHADMPQLTRQKFIKFSLEQQDYITHIDGEMNLSINGKYAWRDAEIIATLSFAAKNTIHPGFTIHSINPMKIQYSLEKWGVLGSRIACAHDSYKDSPLIVSIENIEGKRLDIIDLNAIVVSMPPEFYRSFIQFCDLHEKFVDEQSFYHDFLSKNHLEFSFNLNKTEDRFKIDGIASKGFYWIANRIWQIHDSTISYEKNILKASIGLSIQNKKVGINIDYPVDSLAPIDLEVFDYCAKDEKIRVHLSQESDHYIIERIDGKIPGIEIEFIPKYHKYDPIFALTGKIGIDFSKLRDFFPASIQKQMKELELGKGYEIMGDVVLNYHDLKNSYFEGSVKGRDFEIIGYSIRNFMANAKVVMDGIFLKDLRISDEAGVVWVEEINLRKEDNQPVIDIPKVEMSDFRPSLMFKRSMKSKKIKPLIITYARLDNLKGPITQLENIKGSGTFSFINTLKREFTILDIPLELLSRLGLDMKLLIPIKGQIDFQIENKKILLKELKDSVSEGKRSHFFLSKKRPSYVDFDGNMQIDIKMQQHVLLKLTQPFTLSIRGSVFQPQFSLK